MVSRSSWRRTLALAIIIVAAFIGQLGAPALASTSAAQRMPVSRTAGGPAPSGSCGVPIPC